jgi:hypothetical protein
MKEVAELLFDVAVTVVVLRWMVDSRLRFGDHKYWELWRTAALVAAVEQRFGGAVRMFCSRSI